jgi:heme oxygenase (staphylobilin-producing)
MYLVTVPAWTSGSRRGVPGLNDAIQAAAEDTDGYLGKRSWHAPGNDEVLVVYYGESLDTLDSFAADADHRRAKQRWTECYDAYEVTVTGA